MIVKTVTYVIKMEHSRRRSEQFELIKEKLECQNIYGYRVLNVFPWLSSIYYEDMVTYQDK